jgi:predicted Zn-dependent protease
MESQYSAAPQTDQGMAAFQQVAAAITPHAMDLPGYVTLHFAVIESDEEMAISLPDGHIYISSGLLAKIAGDPDEIACVLGHEVGHVALGHDIDNLTAALGDSPVADMLAQGEYQDVVNTEIELNRLSYSKDQEATADRYSVQLARASGYDASALVRFLTMVAAEPRTPSEVYWSDSHPLFKHRISRVDDDIRRLSH